LGTVFFYFTVSTEQPHKSQSEAERRTTFTSRGLWEVAICLESQREMNPLSQWEKGQDLKFVGPHTNKCAAAKGNTVYASSFGSSTIYTTSFKSGKFQECEWKTLTTSKTSIKCLFSDNEGSCLYICASDGTKYDKIFRFHTEDEKPIASFTQIATINPLEEQEYQRNSLFRKYSSLSLTASQTHIYLVQNNARDASVVSTYDLGKQIWLEKKTLPFSCWDSSCAYIDIDNTLYVLGSGIQPTSTEFNIPNVVGISSNEPKCRTSLPSVPQNFAQLTVDKDNHLIAVGGREYEGTSNSASLLDWRLKKWLPLPDMICGHYCHGTCVTENNTLVVIGGYGNNTTEFLSVPETVINHYCV
jgi:hypothetical protein